MRMHMAQTQPRVRTLERSETVDLEARVLAKNDALADRNRAWFAGREILALNLVSSPGSGKMTLLKRTIHDRSPNSGPRSSRAIRQRRPMAIVSVPPVHRVYRSIPERVANSKWTDRPRARRAEAGIRLRGANRKRRQSPLVCPALFDLESAKGGHASSATEGEDKPLGYPPTFRAGRVVLLDKIHPSLHLDFDVEKAIANVKLNLNAIVFGFRLARARGWRIGTVLSRK